MFAWTILVLNESCAKDFSTQKLHSFCGEFVNISESLKHLISISINLGVQGFTGNEGAPGSKGSKGDPGPIGPRGQKGSYKFDVFTPIVDRFFIFFFSLKITLNSFANVGDRGKSGVPGFSGKNQVLKRVSNKKQSELAVIWSEIKCKKWKEKI